MYILGISCFYHDAAACLLKDGEIVAAAAEERFTRIKHDNSFPIQAIDYCLRFAGIAANELETVVFYEKPLIKFERILHQHLDTFPKSFSSGIQFLSSWSDQKLQVKECLQKQFYYHGTVQFVPHHVSHAASSYYLSSFNEAVIITLDGVGEWATTTIGVGIGPKIKLDKEIHFPHSLGLLYSALTTYLGFSANDAEYKVMGLAAYGNPGPFRSKLDKLVKIFTDGSYQLDMQYFDYAWSSNQMFSSKLSELLGYPPRKPESPMQSCYENIAASLQELLEKVVFNIVEQASKQYSSRNLCLSGGVALNSVMNGKILSKTPFKQLFIPPDPGDAGGAIGAVLYYYHQNFIG